MNSPSIQTRRSLTDDQLTQYDNDGYLLVKNAIPQETIDAIIANVIQVVDQKTEELLREGSIQDPCSDLPFETRWAEVSKQINKKYLARFGWHTCAFDRSLYDLWTEPNIIRVAQDIIGEDIQFNGDFWVRPKLPSQQRTTLPWHQDSAYMPNTESQNLPTIWLPLVPVNSENGALQFIPGSHKHGLIPHNTKDPSDSFNTPSEDPSEGREVVTLPMDPGDFVIFDNLTFHRSTLNLSDGIRWSSDFRFSPTGTPMDHLWHAEMCFPVAGKSASDFTWERIKEKWLTADKQRSSFP